MRVESLEQLRLELRGPIAKSPFAGKEKQPKLDYCDRQIKFYGEQYARSCLEIFYGESLRWKAIKRQVESGKL